MSDVTAEIRAVTGQILDRVGVDTQTPTSGVDDKVWTELRDNGFTEIESDSGGTLADLLAVVSAISYAGAVTPFVEHAVLAEHVASSAGLTLTGTTTLAVADTRCRLDRDSDPTGPAVLTGVVSDVVVADADAILVVVPGADTVVAQVDLSAQGVDVRHGHDLVGAPIADVEFVDVAVAAVGTTPLSAARIRERGALAYACALAAAAARVRDATVAYASERTQFGRPLTKFQAIQQRLAQLAATTALMEAAVTTAVNEYGCSTADHDTRLVAAAKAVTSACARDIAAAGHQIHGAIGFTSEHSLGRATTSLWTWRDRYGHEQHWTDVLGAQIVDGGIDVWDIIVGAVGPAAPRQEGSQP